jgi:hypothetical protein
MKNLSKQLYKIKESSVRLFLQSLILKLEFFNVLIFSILI